MVALSVTLPVPLLIEGNTAVLWSPVQSSNVRRILQRAWLYRQEVHGIWTLLLQSFICLCGKGYTTGTRGLAGNSGRCCCCVALGALPVPMLCIRTYICIAQQTADTRMFVACSICCIDRNVYCCCCRQDARQGYRILAEYCCCCCCLLLRHCCTCCRGCCYQ